MPAPQGQIENEEEVADEAAAAVAWHRATKTPRSALCWTIAGTFASSLFWLKAR